MHSYPFDLIFAATLAWASIFLGALPARLIRDEIFRLQVFLLGCAWIVIAVIGPQKIFHFYLLLGLIHFVSWWKLRQDDGLHGKWWLHAASGIAIGAGVILILADTPHALPPDHSLLTLVLPVASIYLGGAFLGLASMLFIFTRKTATENGISPDFVGRLAGLLVPLLGLRLVLLIAKAILTGVPHLITAIMLLFGWLLLIVLARLARARVVSPAPSRSGLVLMILFLIGFALETLAALP